MTVNDANADSDGVPDIVPLDETVRPAGMVPPVFAYVYGAVPPIAVSDWLYDVPTIPSGSVGGEITIAGQVSAIEYARLPVHVNASVTVIVKGEEPDTVGVPEIIPLVARDNPDGSVPVVTAYVYGPVPPLAVTVWL